MDVFGDPLTYIDSKLYRNAFARAPPPGTGPGGVTCLPRQYFAAAAAANSRQRLQSAPWILSFSSKR